MQSRHVVVIGGGVGGLAAAIRLAAQGFRVTLFESGPSVGGKLNVRTVQHPARLAERPFRFDTGPSLLTMPFVFEQLFEAAGDRLDRHLDLQQLDPIARYQWPDGDSINLSNNDELMSAELSRFSNEDAAGFFRFIERGEKIWSLSAEMFLFNAPEQLLRPPKPAANSDHSAEQGGPSASAFDRLKTAWSMLSIPVRIGMFRKFATDVDRAVRHPKLRELLYQYATYSGASPFRAPATLAVIPYVERHFGAWYPMGGMYRLAEELEALALRLGVTVRTSCPVAKVLIEPIAKSPERRRSIGRAVGVVTAGGEEIRADAVVCNADVVYAYRDLVPAAFRRKYSDRTIDRIEPGGSGLALMLGVEGTYPQLAHHNKFMPADYRDDLVSMFETRTVPREPCIYVCASTRTDPSQAPDGCENLFVLASAPSLDGRIDWEREGQRYRDQLVHTLETKWGLTKLADRIVVERRISPSDLRSLYNANAGSIYGIGSNNLKNAFLRPPNRDRDVSSLYFVGGATHPGGGLPLVALSGKIAAEMVTEDLS